MHGQFSFLFYRISYLCNVRLHVNQEEMAVKQRSREAFQETPTKSRQRYDIHTSEVIDRLISFYCYSFEKLSALGKLFYPSFQNWYAKRADYSRYIEHCRLTAELCSKKQRFSRWKPIFSLTLARPVWTTSLDEHWLSVCCRCSFFRVTCQSHLDRNVTKWKLCKGCGADDRT